MQNAPRIEYPAMPIDLAPSLGQAPAIGRLDGETPSFHVEPSLRLLPQLLEPEPFWKRSLYLLIALAITAAYFFLLFSYWAPAPGRPGIDENGYLVGGKNFALHGTTGFKPADNYQFVGAMWVRTTDEVREPGIGLPQFLKRKLTVHTEAGWYYPKYPVGTSMLDALGIWLGGPKHGREGAFLVSPVCATLAVLGMFLLVRSVAGSFLGLLAMIVLGTGQTMLELAIDPNSHAPSLCMTVWGMFMLLRWWQTGRVWRGIAAGLLLGFAVAIRYTEALLLFPLYPLDQVLRDTDLSKNHPHWWQLIKVVRLLPLGPIGLAVLLSIRWNRVQSYFLAAVPVLAWGLVVGALVTFNWFTMGHITGYDQTNESMGFSTAEFLKKWDFTVHELYLYGSFLIFPLGLIGIALMFRRSARAGLMMALWVLPGALLYNAYYWGQQAPGVGFLRFYLTLFPPLIAGCMWLLHAACDGANLDRTNRRRTGSFAAPLAGGLLTVAAASVGISISLPDLERQHRGNMNTSISGHRVLDKIQSTTSGRGSKVETAHRPAPVIIADEGLFPQLLQYLQFMTDAECYAVNAFDVRIAGGFGLFGVGQRVENKQDAPVLLQRERIDFMTEFLKNKSAADLVKEQHRMMDQAFENGRPVYTILTPVQLIEFKRRFMSDAYQMVELDHWAEPFAIRFPEEDRSGRPGAAQHTSVLSPRAWNGEPFIHWQPQALSLMQIEPKAPATHPAVVEKD